MTTGDQVSLRPVTRASVRAVCRLEPSFHPVAEGAGGFRARCGFRDGGRELRGELVAVRTL